jgi:hypothetical protein
MTEEPSKTTQSREGLAGESSGAAAVRRLFDEGDTIENTLAALEGLPGITCAAWVSHADNETPSINGVHPRLLPGAPIPPWLYAACQQPSAVNSCWVELSLPGPPARRLLCLTSANGDARRTIAITVEDEFDADASGYARAIALVGMHTSEAGIQPHNSTHATSELHQAMLLLAVANRFDIPAAAFRSICDEFASRWVCDRASLAVLEGDRVRMLSISHAEKLTKNAALLRMLSDTVEEAIDQNSIVVYPNNGSEPIIDRAARDLANTTGAAACVLACPIRVGEHPMGAIVLERFSGMMFTAQEQGGAEIACELISRRTAELVGRSRSIFTRIQLGARRRLASLVGPSHTWAKLFFVSAALFLALSLILRGTDYAAGTGRVTASVSRTIASPFSGFIDTGYVRVGDQVERDQTVIATLDIAELELQLAQARAEESTYISESAHYQDQMRAADAAIASARAKEIGARISLIEFQISSATLRSPIDGVVVEGDTRQLSGASIAIGQPVARIVHPESIYIHLEIPESEMRGVRVGSAGHLLTPAYPDVPLDFVVTEVASLVVEEGAARYLVAKASIDHAPDWLVPGMHGTARIRTENRPLLMVWTRRLSDWLRLKLWI